MTWLTVPRDLIASFGEIARFSGTVIGAVFSGKVLRFLGAVAPAGVSADVVLVNGSPALRLMIDGVLDGVGSVLVEDGLVTGLYIVRNPEKLARLDQLVSLTR